MIETKRYLAQILEQLVKMNETMGQILDVLERIDIPRDADGNIRVAEQVRS